MAFLKIVKDIIALLAAHLLTKALLGIGLSLFIFGGVIVYVILDLIMRWFGFEASTIKTVSVIASILTSLLGMGLFAIGICLLLWARKNNLDLS